MLTMTTRYGGDGGQHVVPALSPAQATIRFLGYFQDFRVAVVVPSSLETICSPTLILEVYPAGDRIAFSGPEKEVFALRRVIEVWGRFRREFCDALLEASDVHDEAVRKRFYRACSTWKKLLDWLALAVDCNLPISAIVG